MPNVDQLMGRRVVVTEKMDGENTTLHREYIHARSVDSRNHPSRNWIKNLWGQKRHSILVGTRICGENLYAQHSIPYNDLKSYFLAFSVWQDLPNDDSFCLSWDYSKFIISKLGFEVVPIIAEGVFSREFLKEIEQSLDETKQEGYVVRTLESFKTSDFPYCVGKYVRPNHVQTNEHWMNQPMVQNKLRNE